jgi:ribosome biogenesis protein BMS1
VTLYGYVRGTHLQPHHKVHLIGVGDFPISGLSSLEDPCHQPGVPGGDLALQERATLKKKDNLLYAPLANVGRVKIDSDGVYIELKTVHYTKRQNLVIGDQGIYVFIYICTYVYTYVYTYKYTYIYIHIHI